MTGNVIAYLDNIKEDIPPEILSPENYVRLRKMAVFFQDVAASKYILETHLNTEDPFVDFSFRVLETEKDILGEALNRSILPQAGKNQVWQRLQDFITCWSQDDLPSSHKVRNIWFELDYKQAENKIPEPCFFFDAAKITRGFSSEISDAYLWWSEKALGSLLGDRQLNLLRESLNQVVRLLPWGKIADTGVMLGTGVMLARKEDRVRIYTSPLTSEQIEDFLKKISWPGRYGALEKMFLLADDLCKPYYVFGFDVTPEGIAEKVGMEIRLKNHQVLPAFLRNLVEKGLCTDVKRKGILSWRGIDYKYLGREYGQTLIVKDISHFKVSWETGKDLGVKLI
ncbi:MAG: hypothetical protein ACOX4L_03830 [Bacillota bacterium]